jgi:hypothetical protein
VALIGRICTKFGPAKAAEFARALQGMNGQTMGTSRADADLAASRMNADLASSIRGLQGNNDAPYKWMKVAWQTTNSAGFIVRDVAGEASVAQLPAPPAASTLRGDASSPPPPPPPPPPSTSITATWKQRSSSTTAWRRVPRPPLRVPSFRSAASPLHAPAAAARTPVPWASASLRLFAWCGCHFCPAPPPVVDRFCSSPMHVCG